MLLDTATGILEKLVKEIRETDPAKRDHLVKSATMLLGISTEALKDNPEFRRAFAMVHSEFLKYPECADTLEQGIKAYREYLG